MTKQEAITYLEDEKSSLPYKFEQALDMAIKALEASAWIPVGDEPPKQKKTYWICTDGGYQCECRWTNVHPFWTDLTTDWHWCSRDLPQYSEVVAWMPLPEPYKGGEE